MIRRTLLLTSLLPLGALLPAGCAQHAAVPPLTADHPASPAAPEAPLPQASDTLAPYDEVKADALSDDAATKVHGDMQGMSPGMNMGSMKKGGGQ